MLGLRLAYGCQIDLHQGDAALFVADLTIRDQKFADQLRLAAAKAPGQARHVSFAIEESGASAGANAALAEAAMADCKAFLMRQTQAGVPPKVARITFVLSSGALYEVFRDAMFRAFPEEL